MRNEDGKRRIRDARGPDGGAEDAVRAGERQKDWQTIAQAALAWADECDGWADETAQEIRAAVERLEAREG